MLQEKQINPSEEAATEQFEQKVKAVIQRPLNPENIDEYMDRALEDLVGIANHVTALYDRLPTIKGDNQKATEDNAFEYFNLANLNELLDSVMDNEALLKNINQVIANAPTSDDVYVDALSSAMRIVKGEGEAEFHRLLPRLQTLLFLLNKDFGVSFEDNSEFRLSKGGLDPDMFRKESYYMIELPSLERTILVCDEEGNRTYIFDNKALEQKGLNQEELVKAKKRELTELLHAHSELGISIKYSDSWAMQMIEAIKDPHNPATSTRESHYRPLAQEPAPPEVESINAIGKEAGMDHRVAKRIVQEMADVGMLELKRYSFRGQPNIGLGPDEKQAFMQFAGEKGLGPLAKKLVSRESLATELGITSDTVDNAVRDLLRNGSEAFEGYGTNPTDRMAMYLSEQQRQAVIDYVTERGALGERLPDGFKTIQRFATENGYNSEHAYEMAYEMEINLPDTFGKLGKFKVPKPNVIGLSPVQQAMMKQRFEAMPFYQIPKAAADEESLRSLGRKWGVAQFSMEQAYQAAASSLGDLPERRFGPTPAKAFDAEKQRILKSFLPDKYAHIRDGEVSEID